MTFRIRKRPSGAVTTVSRRGAASTASATGAVLELSNAASTPGFNPVDLLYASLSACLALSTRIAASELGLFERFESVRVSVSGEMTASEFSRVETISVRLEIAGMLSDVEKADIAERAERICTVSNTLRESPRIDVA